MIKVSFYKIIFALALFATGVFAFPNAVDAQTVVLDNVLVSEDFSKFANSHVLGYIQSTERGEFGVHFGHATIDDAVRQSYVLSGVSYSLGTSRVDLEADYYRLFSDSGENLGSLLIRARPHAMVSTDLFYTREFAEITTLAGRELVFDTYGATVDVFQGDNSLTAGYLRQFIDDVTRNHYIANASVPLNENSGILIANRVINSDGELSYAFTPRQFSSHLVGVYYGLTALDDNLWIRPALSGGVKFVNSQAQGSYELNIRSRYWAADRYGIITDLYFNNSRSEFYDSSVVYATVTLTYRLN